jgi:hypothetical protein
VGADGKAQRRDQGGRACAAGGLSTGGEARECQIGHRDIPQAIGQTHIVPEAESVKRIDLMDRISHIDDHVERPRP